MDLGGANNMAVGLWLDKYMHILKKVNTGIGVYGKWMDGWLGKLQITILVIIYSLRIASAISQRPLVPLFKRISTIQLVIGRENQTWPPPSDRRRVQNSK